MRLSSKISKIKEKAVLYKVQEDRQTKDEDE